MSLRGFEVKRRCLTIGDRIRRRRDDDDDDDDDGMKFKHRAALFLNFT